MTRTLSIWVQSAVAGLLVTASLAAPAHGQMPKPMLEREVKAAGGRQVPVAELRRAIVGNTVYVLLLRSIAGSPAGSVIPAYYRDERARVQWLPDGRKLESNWWFEADNVCVEQRNQNRGHQCWSAWDFAGTRYFCLQPAGDCFVAVRYAPGNAEGL
jgi:hypothetical protein